MAYYVGDIPADDIVIEPARNGEVLDLTPFTAASTTAVLKNFEGETIAATFSKAFTDGDVVLGWPATSVLAEAGLHSITVTLNGTGVKERLPLVYIVVQDDDGWQTVDSARDDWPGAAQIDERRLWQLLELAKQQVLEYAPELEADAAIPLNYREGQLMQARNLYNAALIDSGSGELGGGEFTIRPFPLDWQVKQVLRPKSAVPKVG